MDFPDGLLTRAETLAYFGGNKPLSVPTLYSGMRLGRYPRPVHVGGARWVRSECEAAVRRMIAERDEQLAATGIKDQPVVPA